MSAAPAHKLARAGHEWRLSASQTDIRLCVCEWHSSTNEALRLLCSDELTERQESMTTIEAIRLASLVTAINVLVASGFSIAAIIRPQILVPPEPDRKSV